MSSLDALRNWINENRDQFTEDYFTFLSFKSISTDPEYKNDMEKCIQWLTQYIQMHTNFSAEIVQTEGAPLLLAENLNTGKEKSTLLMYGHYDVQPVDPIDLWESDPFKPEVRDGKVYARGAVDNKGQIFYAIIAMRALKELGIKPNVGLKFCIEGEEESSSIGLSKSLNKLKDKLVCDSLLVIDFDQFNAETPALILGARGIAAFEVILTGSNSDLHSGIHGGMAYNPNRAMVELLSKAVDESGRIQIKGFYDDVVELSSEEQNQLAFAYERAEYTKEFGVAAFGGEKGRSLAENNGLRPTFEINGISSGYTGTGFKTVIPKEARVKISCRLVPYQDAEKIAKNVEVFFKENTPEGIEVEVIHLGAEKAFRSSPNTKIATAVSEAATEVCGKTCKNIVSGGSIPIIAQMCEVLGAEVVGMGYGLLTDSIHAPNEHFDMKRFEKGLLTVARVVEKL